MLWCYGVMVFWSPAVEAHAMSGTARVDFPLATLKFYFAI